MENAFIYALNTYFFFFFRMMNEFVDINTSYCANVDFATFLTEGVHCLAIERVKGSVTTFSNKKPYSRTAHRWTDHTHGV